MLRKSLILALLALLPLSLFANKPDPVIGPDSPLPPVINPVPLGPWGPTDDYVGTVYLLGTTWYDYQHNGSTSRQIGLDANGAVHIVWMKGMESGATNRHIFYNAVTAAGTVVFTNGDQVSTYRSGYTTLDLTAANLPAAFYHATVDSNRGACGIDASYLAGNFNNVYAPMPSPIRGLTWPHGVVDHQGYIHMVLQTNPNTTLYYTVSTNGGASFQTPVSIASTTGMAAISQTMAASSVNNKVVYAYTHPLATNYQQEDVFYFESLDGVTWPANPVNITNFGVPGHPMYNTVRAWTYVNALYDNTGNLHLAYTAITYPTVTGAAVLWHWSQATGHTKIAGELEFSGPYAHNDPGAWHSCWDLPCLGIDAAGVLYCAWEQCTAPGDSSQGGWGNYEVYVNYSTDNGAHWMAPVDITNTHTPLGAPGQCMSEAWPTLAKKVDNYLHIEYIQDKDAGGIPQTEGTWTDNPVIYQRVPVEDILTDITLTLTPINPPIIIPPGGGSFQYTFAITNNSDNSAVADVWTEMILPNGTTYGPVVLRNLITLGAGASVSRTLTQSIPGNAPAGNYTYRGCIGDQGYSVWASGDFPFVKSGVDNGKGGISGWSCSSWEGSEEGSAVVLEKFTALTVTPNPFNPTAEIAFNLSEGGMVKLSVHDITGREVAVLSEGYESPGWHKITFTSSNLASGVYFFTLKSGDEIKTAKSLLLK